jgi:hypothetical protein
MKSPSSKTCVQRVSLALVAVAGLSLMIACGSNNSTQPNNNGFNATFLNGTYVFSTTGTDSSSNNTLIALAGAFTANGNAGITGGTMDIIDPSVGVDAAESISSGSYSVSSDGRGQVKLATAVGNFTLDFVLTTSSAPSTHGLVSEFDTNGSGSGTLDLQTAPSGQSALAGPYAFNFGGMDSNGNPFSSAGAFTLGSGGTSTAGIADFNRIINDAVSPFLGTGLTVSAILGSGTAPGTATFSSAYASAATFDFYPIDSTHWKMIETDGAYYLAGDVYTQTGFTTIPSGTLVFTLGGTTTSAPVAAGGLMTSDGTGNFPSGAEDLNNGGATGSLPFTGTAAGAAGTGGRVLVNLGGFSPSIQWVVYPSSGGVLMMVTDTSGILTGSAFAQTATAFNVPDGYGFNLSGANPNSETDQIAQFNATSATTNNMTGVLDENLQGAPTTGIALTGTYTPDSPATGRGNISATAPQTFLGGFNLEYYTIDASDALFIDIDSSANGGTPQVAVGTFEGQGGVSAGVNGAATSTVHRVESVVHPPSRSKQAKITKGAFRLH